MKSSSSSAKSHRWRWSITAVAAAGILGAMAISPTAKAQEGPTPPPGMKIVKAVGNGYVAEPVLGNLSKKQWLEKYGKSVQDFNKQKASAAANQKPSAAPKNVKAASGSADCTTSSLASLSGEQISDGEADQDPDAQVFGSSYWVSCAYALLGSAVTFTDSDALGEWIGYPDASSITTSETWNANGLAVSPSVPAGLTIGSDGTSVTYSAGALTGSNEQELIYDGPINEEAAYISSFQYSDQASINVGSATYVADGTTSN